ncbi:outer membrane beta-barrel protein [Spirosoma areae]
MKKVIFGLLLTVAGMGRIQAQSNTLLVYGNVGYDSQKAGNARATDSFNFSPGVGYQWNDNWTAGLNLGISNASSGTAEASAFSVGPFIRYTQPLAGPFAIYGQLNANYLSGKAGNTTLNGFGATLFPAIGVDLKKGFALNFTFGSLSFTSQKVEGAPESTTNFHVGFGSGAGFGISKNFGLKK